MTTSTKAQDLLLDIANEKNGFSIGTPWRFSEFSLCAIIPLVRETSYLRGYRLLTEVDKEVKIKDTGDIKSLEVTNNSGLPVLIRAGDIMLGATQERIATFSQVLMPGEKSTLGCACVHASKGIRSGQVIRAGGTTPSRVRQVLYTSYKRDWGNSLKHNSAETLNKSVYSGRLQNELWSSVKSYSSSMAGSRSEAPRYQRRSRPANSPGLGSLGDLPGTSQSWGGYELDSLEDSPINNYWSSGSDDLAGRLKESEDKYKEILKKAPKVENQVGMCLVGLNGFDTLDSFDHPDSWEGLRKSILKSEASKLAESGNEDFFEFKLDKAKEILSKMLSRPFKEKIVLDREHSKTILLNEGNLTGEVVLLYNEPILLTLNKS